jgi:hypothetical protein
MILFLDLLVLITIGLLILGLVTQVFVPLYRGSVLFPFFRKTQVSEQVAEAEHTLEELTDAEHLKQLNDEIERRKAQLKETE